MSWRCARHVHGLCSASRAWLTLSRKNGAGVCTTVRATSLCQKSERLATGLCLANLRFRDHALYIGQERRRVVHDAVVNRETDAADTGRLAGSVIEMESSGPIRS